MTLPLRVACRLHAIRCASRCTRRLATTSNATSEQSWPQKQPLGDYYKQILNAPSPYNFKNKPEEPPNSATPEVLPESKKPIASEQTPERKPQTATSATIYAPPSAPQSSPPVPTPPPTTAEEAARRIFGSRLYGEEERAQHAAVKQAQSTLKGGVLIPPRPEEPDNCCMSGCVNCVWDRYREDVEEWASKVKEAEAHMAKLAAQDSITTEEKPKVSEKPTKVGDEKISPDMWEEDAFQGVPLGIREFMKLEKQLKDRHAHEHTTGG